MRPRFKTRPADERLLESVPVRLRDVFAVPRPASAVWADLTSDEALAWCRILQAVTWTSPRPFGVGTTRTVRSLWGASVFEERFFRWEEGRRQSFCVERSSTPAFRRFAEDYLVEPVSDTSCRLTWTIAYEPGPGMGLGTPLNRMLLGTLFRDTRRHYGAP